MLRELTNDQIALLCKIEERRPSPAEEDQQRDLQLLNADGYVRPSDTSPSGLALTAKARDLLGKRGAGLDEA